MFLHMLTDVTQLEPPATLAENPRLTTLELSLQYSATQQGYRIDNLEDPELEHNKFCWRMCSAFSNELKQLPLSLQRLHLGKVLELTWTESGAPHQSRSAQAGVPVRRRIRRFHLHLRRRSRAHGLLARELSPSLRDLCHGASRQLSGVCWIRGLRLRSKGSMCRTVGSSPEAELSQNNQVYRRKRLGPRDFDDREVPFRTRAAN
jgi:hypothetical protein